MSSTFFAGRYGQFVVDRDPEVWIRETYDINNTPQDQLLAMIREERSRNAALTEANLQPSRKSLAPSNVELWNRMRGSMLEVGQKNPLFRTRKPRDLRSFYVIAGGRKGHIILRPFWCQNCIWGASSGTAIVSDASSCREKISTRLEPSPFGLFED